MAENTKIDMEDVNNLDIGEGKGGILKKLNSSTIHMIVDALGFLFMFVYFKGQNSSLKQEIISLRREFEDFQNQTKGYIRYLGSKMLPESGEEVKQQKKSVRFSDRNEYKEIPEESGYVEEEPQVKPRIQSYHQPQQQRPQVSQPQIQPQETKHQFQSQPTFQPQEMKQSQFQQPQEIKQSAKFEQPKELPKIEELPRVGPEENTTSLPESEDFSEELKDEFKR